MQLDSLVEIVFQDALTEEHVVKSLHNKEQAFNIMTITYVLSRLGTQSLGDFEIKYAWDPTSVAALKKYVQYQLCRCVIKTVAYQKNV